MKNSKKTIGSPNPLYLDGHRPRNRREMLAQGFLGFSALATFGSLPSIGMRQALAASPDAANFADAPPFLVFDMAGGAALPGNFLVGGPGGPKDLLSNYDLLGWNPRSGSWNEEFGLPMGQGVSTLLQGILDNTSAAARANLRMGSFCHFAQDDSSSNELNAAALVTLSGTTGQFVTNGLGIQNSISGGRSRGAFENATLKPTFVKTINDVLGAVDFGGAVNLDPHQLVAMAKGGSILGGLQADIYRSREGGELLASLSKTAYDKSMELVEGVDGLDPRQDDLARQVYGIAQGAAADDPTVIAAAVSMNAIKGFSGPGTWTLGGCDYHNRTQTTGDARDNDMGIMMGRAIELAHRMNKPLFFELLTDGGCDSVQGSRKWRGDSGDKCMTVIGYYHPDGPPKYYEQAGSGEPRIQVGNYTNGQGANRNTLIGSEPLLVGCAVFANYLAVTGRLESFHEYAPGIFTGDGELESVLIFSGEIG